jgi:hypothetical protein
MSEQTISETKQLWQRWISRYRAGGILCSVALLAAPAATECGAPPPPPPDLDMKATDFECVQHWPKIGNYRIINKLGHQSEAESVAGSPNGGTFPVGTVIQLVPTEASVKRAPGFNPEHGDWEFFSLQISSAGTTISARGGDASVKNQFGSSCLNCHSKAAKQWDLLCGENHGCDPLPFSGAFLAGLQNTDPRCP